MSFRLSHEVGLFRVDRSPVVFCFDRILISKSSVKVYISNQMFYARILCSTFRLKN